MKLNKDSRVLKNLYTLSVSCVLGSKMTNIGNTFCSG